MGNAFIENKRMLVAAREGDYDTAESAIKCGADFSDGDPALYCAAQDGHTSIVKLFLDNHDYSAEALDDAFLAAAKNDKPMTVKALLDAGANVHAEWDEAVQHLAQMNTGGDTLRIILEHGAFPHANNYRPLIDAIESGLENNARLLAEYGADFDRLEEIWGEAEDYKGDIDRLRDWQAEHRKQTAESTRKQIESETDRNATMRRKIAGRKLPHLGR